MNRETSLSSSWIFKIIVINLVVYFIQELQPSPENIAHFNQLFGLVPEKVISEGKVWQLFTYMFLHGGILHLLVNMYLLYIFGRAIEEAWGSKKFIQYYLFCGIGAGLLILIIGYFTDGTSARSAYSLATIGASGAVFGVLLAFAMLFPNMEFMLLIPPMPMKAKHLVILYGAIAFFSEIGQVQDNISHIGHLGGILFGLIYFFTIHKIRPAHTRKFNSKVGNARKTVMLKEKEKIFSEDKNFEIKKAIIRKLKKNANLDNLTDDEYQYIKYLDIMIDTENIKHKNEPNILSKKKISDFDFIMEVKRYISFSDS